MKTPLGGISDSWLLRFERQAKTKRSGDSNDPILDSVRRLERRQRLKKAKMLPKGLPSAASAAVLQHSLAEPPTATAGEKAKGVEKKTTSTSKRAAGHIGDGLKESATTRPAAAAAVDSSPRRVTSQHLQDKRQMVLHEAAAHDAADDDAVGDARGRAWSLATDTAGSGDWGLLGSDAYGHGEKRAPHVPLSLLEVLPAMQGMTPAEQRAVNRAYHRPDLQTALAEQDEAFHAGSQQTQDGDQQKTSSGSSKLQEEQQLLSQVELEHTAVALRSTVTASELDAIEAQHTAMLQRRVSAAPREILNLAYARRPAATPPPPPAFGDSSSSSAPFHAAGTAVPAAYHQSPVISSSGYRPPAASAAQGGINYAKFFISHAQGGAASSEAQSDEGARGGTHGTEMLDAGLNAHFPVETETQHYTHSDADADAENNAASSSFWRRAHDPTLPALPPLDGTAYDAADDAGAAKLGAYYRRASANDILPRTLATDVWTEGATRASLMETVNAYDATKAADRLADGPMDCIVPDFHAEVARRAHLKFLTGHPINEMIQEPFCRIVSFEPRNGDPDVTVRQALMPTSQGRAMARQYGLDLIRTGTQLISTTAPHEADADNEEGGGGGPTAPPQPMAPPPTPGVKQLVAVCVIGDAREHLRRDVKFRLSKQGVNAPPPLPLVDMEFRGGCHPFAIRHKVARVVRQLIRGAPARINLKDFGSPSEGFPVFQTILDEIRLQANGLKAFHRAGPITSEYDEISCFLLPSTTKRPISGVIHPTSSELEETKRLRQMEEQREIHFDSYYDLRSAKDRLTYAYKIRDGTAWAHQDEGLSLRDQRRLKVFTGFIPKGNKGLYSRRGDVNTPFPFKTNHITTMDRWNHQTETNLDQSERASAVLGKRRHMNISDMHDLGETEDNPSVVDKFQYRMSGHAMHVGDLKEQLGLKTNRKKVPQAAGPWGTLGKANTESSPHFTTK